MLKGCFIFSLKSSIKSEEVCAVIEQKLSSKNIKYTSFKIEDVGYTKDRIESLIKENLFLDFVNAVASYAVKLGQDDTFVICQGYNVDGDNSLFYSKLNEKLAMALSLPTLVISDNVDDGVVMSLSPYIDAVPSLANVADETIDVLLNWNSENISGVMTQLMMTERAKKDVKRIVLPEGNSPRIIAAAAEIKKLGFAHPVLLGNKQEIEKVASDLGLDVSGLEIICPLTCGLLEEYASEYYELRKHKGMTEEKAIELMKKVSFFGTMMVHKGFVDGMVSGAEHTTAETILPSLQFIKTKPGISTVSGAFLMCVKNRMYIFSDCGVTPKPTPSQISHIANSAVDFASVVGIDPKVALLSYSTGNSSSGDGVDDVKEALAIIKENYPEMLVDGPLQFDAAINEGVAKTKIPNSPVAGKANIFIFPDLNAGNNVYKAVQRTGEDVIAMGPILLGLKKPVNDLSRGSTVLDIINTVAITALQSQTN